MHAALDQTKPLVASENEAAIAKRAADSLRAIALADKDVELVVSENAKITVPLPAKAVQAILFMLDAMSQRKAFSVIPHETELTTQQAADFLNVSRPYLTNLIDSGKIEHRLVGRHRRMKFADLLAYQEQSKAERRQAILEMLEEEQRLGLA
jgi:excisionase family DNA binding protein